MDAIRSVYRKYTDFSGRATRSEFWWFWLFYAVATIVLSVIAAVSSGTMQSIAYIAIAIFVIGSLIPILALIARRLHDTDHSGWWLLLTFVPIVGGLILLFFYILPGTPGPNRFDRALMPATA